MKRHLQWQVEHGYLTNEDSELIYNFITDRALERGLSDSTMVNRTRYLAVFLRSLPCNITECSTKDVRSTIAEMRRRYKPNTFNMMLYLIRGFLQWLRLENIDLRDIEKIKAPKKDFITKTAADMLSEEDIKNMLNACRTSRDRALFSVLYEGGFRPIELVRLTWGQVKFDDYGAVINTAEKTGKPRYIRLIAASPALAAWKSDYPVRIEKNSPVFLKLRGSPPGPITTTTIRRLVEKLARKSNVDKGLYPYLIRHSHVTHQIEQGIPESVIRMQHWGSMTSRMLATYAPISNDHIDKVLLEQAGVKPLKEKRSSTMKPVQCEKCNTINLPGARFCNTCGRPLTEDAEDQVENAGDKIRKLLKENPAAKEAFFELLDELEK